MTPIFPRIQPRQGNIVFPQVSEWTGYLAPASGAQAIYTKTGETGLQHFVTAIHYWTDGTVAYPMLVDGSTTLLTGLPGQDLAMTFFSPLEITQGADVIIKYNALEAAKDQGVFISGFTR